MTKKPKLSMPPVAQSIALDDNQAMLEMINKGGSVLSQEVKEVDKLKSFTFKIYESELQKIREIQDRLPKRDRISIHDFVLDAVLNKIQNEL
jgi:hypothetical protein